MTEQRRQAIEAAVCESEIAGSGHQGDEMWANLPSGQVRLIRACSWHRAEGNEKVRRFVEALDLWEPRP